MKSPILTVLALFMSVMSLAQAQEVLANTPAAHYRYEQHHDFQIFYADFKKALSQRDQAAVFQMTQMPFVCHAIECGALLRDGGEDYDASKDLSMRNRQEFLRKYDQVFTPRWSDFAQARFMNLRQAGDDENSREFFSETEQVLQSFYEDADQNNADVFSFDVNEQGRYQLQNMPYRP